MAKEILLIRHSSVDVPRGHCYGHFDVGVSKDFKKEVKALKRRVSAFQPDKIWSSPLTRCTKLAEAIYDQKYSTDDRLKELNYGNWENRRWKDIDVEEDSDWIYEHPAIAPPNGESFIELQQRVMEFFFEKLDKSKHDKIAVFGHGGVLRSIITYHLKMPLSASKSLKIFYTGHAKLLFEHNRWKLEELHSGVK
jgi:alpha-ribazole phosphatase